MKLPALTTLMLGPLFGLTACTQFEQEWMAFQASFQPEPHYVTVMGRTWTVTQYDHDRPNAWKAVRDNNNLNPYGRPAAPRTPQAVQALQQATGCRVIPATLYQNTSAEFYADMSCG